MNKTLLIIICDFLLISILALVEFKPEVEQALADEQELRDQAAEEMLELLQLSLEHESAQREEVEEKLTETSSELDNTVSQLNQTREALEDTSETLEEVSTTLQMTEEEKAALANSLEQTRSSLNLTLEEKQALQTSLQQNEERSRQLQEELRQQQELAEDKAAALAAAQENLSQLEREQQQMATQLQIRETEKQMLEQNLVTAQAEMERARLEAQRAEARSETLAAEVGQLAASSTELKEEIRSSQALSMNAIYQRFEENRVFLAFSWEERTLFSSVTRQAAIQSLLLDTGQGVFAVFATANTPLGEGARAVSVRMKIGERVFNVKEVGFLEGESGIAAIQVPQAIVEESGLETFVLSEDPLRFSEAVLVSDDQELYGEIPIRVPPGEKGYLEIQNRLFNRLFGEFNPSPGDYVFSMTGELVGIIVRDNRARMIESPVFGDFRELTTPR